MANGEGILIRFRAILGDVCDCIQSDEPYLRGLICKASHRYDCVNSEAVVSYSNFGVELDPSRKRVTSAYTWYSKNLLK